MLEYLAQYTRVPKVLSHAPFTMEYIDHDSSRAGVHLAEVLLSLHGVTSDRFGFHEDTAIGGLPQRNPWCESWCEFFAQHRLLAFVPDSLSSRLHALASRIREVIDEPD